MKIVKGMKVMKGMEDVGTMRKEVMIEVESPKYSWSATLFLGGGKVQIASIQSLNGALLQQHRNILAFMTGKLFLNTTNAKIAPASSYCRNRNL